MLAHMPWYHYLLMAVAVVGIGTITHRRIRRSYWPRHTFVSGNDAIWHLGILAAVELAGIIAVVAVVTAGMLAYHLSAPAPM